ncbi:MAG: hypothetical protein AB8B47_00875 [Roseobacter sp.]
MRYCWIIALFLGARAGLACDDVVCIVDPDALTLNEIITFDDMRSGHGPGHPIKDVLVADGAQFGERFAGQSVHANGDHDQVTGAALSPLTVIPGAKGQNLSVVYFNGNNVLNGYGVEGFPRRRAQGEGAISFLFDDDQSALAFQIRGGEAGSARAVFLSRDGTVLAQLDLPPIGEHAYGFIRANGQADIAGILITNTDPQGLAIDNIRFGKPPELG